MEPTGKPTYRATEEKPKTKEFQNLCDAGMFALGGLMALRDANFLPHKRWLAQALKDAGVESDYIDSILQENKEVEEPKGKIK